MRYLRVPQLLFACLVAFFQLTGVVYAIVVAPGEFGEPVPMEWRAPIGKFLGTLGADDPEAALNNARAMKMQRGPVDRAADNNTILVQVRYGSFCQEKADGCLTVIGRISRDVFSPEVMFFAGGRMNGMDTVPRALGALSYPLTFWSKSVSVTVINTSQGWVVMPARQTNPPQ